VAPDWTEHRDADPGITLVQLFAFLGESLLDRANAMPERGRTQLGAPLRRLPRVRIPPCPDSAMPTRVQYFEGQLITAADLRAEQSYLRDKRRRHNLLLHGPGVVTGLEVTAEERPDGDTVIRVSPGYAIDAEGEEILLCEAATSAPCSGSARCYVTLRLIDRELGITPHGGASRVEEVVEVAVLATAPPEHLAIGRLEQVDGEWRVDPRFAPPRSGR
jgi:hypothetical protein